jgi:hypothetical protein
MKDEILHSLVAAKALVGNQELVEAYRVAQDGVTRANAIGATELEIQAVELCGDIAVELASDLLRKSQDGARRVIDLLAAASPQNELQLAQAYQSRRAA